MGTRSRPISSTPDPYGQQAELAASLAERNFREAAARRAVRDAEPVNQVLDPVEARAAEIDERERALAAREQLIRALERRLEESRRRLEERLQQVKTAPPAGWRGEFRVTSVDGGYFDAGSNRHEDEWWSRQLGKTPPIAA